MKKNLLLTIVAAGVLSFVATARAGDAVISPKAHAQADAWKRVSGTTTSTLDRSANSGSPTGIALADSLRKVPTTASDVDLAHAQAPTLSPKDPRYAQAAREFPQSKYQIAPLK